MRILVVGGGAREHTLCWKLAGEAGIRQVVCAPGNTGLSQIARCVPVDIGDPSAVLSLVEREQIDLTVVGPEFPLTRGLANVLAEAGHPVCGPTREAAELESSKGFAKDLMARHGVPTARYVICETASAALDTLRSGRFGYPVVLKADGLAAGKGVVVAPDAASAEASVKHIMVDRRFGDAGARVLVEECLWGREASFFVLTDGARAAVLPSAQDHKRAFDEDQGPNTGGMGAFSPSPLIDGAMAGRILDEIVFPTLHGMAAEGRPYRGFLYCGLMLTADGPKVIEFNARLGDPETQVILPALGVELLPLLIDATCGRLASGVCRVRPERHVGVVLASGGYPDRFETGHVISGLDAAATLPDVMVFHAGTAQVGSDVVTAGGRVLTVVARGADFASARERAYDAVSRVSFDQMHFRRDIAASLS